MFLMMMRERLGGKKSGFTVYQVHDAVSALVQSWWLNARASTALLERTAEKINYHQQRNAIATRYHVKRTRKKLRQIGIRVSKIKKCVWDST